MYFEEEDTLELQVETSTQSHEDEEERANQLHQLETSSPQRSTPQTVAQQQQ